MNDKRFSSMLFLLAPQIVQLIMGKNLISEEQATELLYNSALYAALEDEQTKLWHLSPCALFEMFQEEQETGQITYPEEA